MRTNPDRFCWRCPTCHKRHSLRKFSFFADKQKKDLSVYLYIMYFFANNIEASTVMKMLHASEGVVYD